MFSSKTLLAKEIGSKAVEVKSRSKRRSMDSSRIGSGTKSGRMFNSKKEMTRSVDSSSLGWLLMGDGGVGGRCRQVMEDGIACGC